MMPLVWYALGAASASFAAWLLSKRRPLATLRLYTEVLVHEAYHVAMLLERNGYNGTAKALRDAARPLVRELDDVDPRGRSSVKEPW